MEDVDDEQWVQNYYPIRQLCITIFHLEDNRFSTEELDAKGIKVYKMNLDGVGDGIRFFEKISSQEFSEVQDLLAFSWPECRDPEPDMRAYDMAFLLLEALERLYWFAPPEKQSPWKFRSVNNTAWEKGIFQDIDPRPRWGVSTILDMYDPAIPHLGCILYDETIMEDDYISRSELYCATALMAGRLSSSQYAKHRIVPVSVYSLSDDNARMIQAYYDKDNSNLIIRKSKITTLKTKEDKSKIDLLLRWIMSKPVGETISPTSSKKKVERPHQQNAEPSSKENKPLLKENQPPSREKKPPRKENQPPSQENKPGWK